MLTVPQFYARTRWGDQWGVRRLVNGVWTNPHRGHDIKTGGRADVPALYPGRVTARGKASILGYYVVVKTGHGYDYYCHLLNDGRPAVGTDIKRGTKIGTTATWGDYTGSAWSGPHLHYGSGPNPRSIFEGATHNATTLIDSALTAIQGGTSTPIPPKRKRKDNDMPAVIKRNEGTPEWSLIWPPLRGSDDKQRGYLVTTDEERAKWWARFYELGQGSEDAFTRAEYIQAQEMARLDHEAWLRGQVAVASAPAAEIDYDRIKAAFPSKLTFDIPPATGTLS